MLKEFAAKKCMKLGRLLKERGGLEVDEMKSKNSSDRNPAPNPNPNSKSEKCSFVKVRKRVTTVLGLDPKPKPNLIILIVKWGGLCRLHCVLTVNSSRGN